MKQVVVGRPAPNIPLSGVIRAGDFLFVSGQIGVDPKTGALPADLTQQTKNVLTHLHNLLEAAGASLRDVVKTTVFLANAGDFAVMNSVYQHYFPDDSPARSTVEAKLARPDAVVEIEAIAYCPVNKE